jgi:hypothetical protein
MSTGRLGSSSRGLALNDFLPPPPGSQSLPGGGEGIQRRRPKAHHCPWRRRGRGGSRRASRSAAEGSPKGLARPRSASAPKGARRAASNADGQAEMFLLSSGRRNGRVAQRLQRSRRGDPRLGARSREGRSETTTRDAAVGGRPLRGPRGGWARGNGSSDDAAAQRAIISPDVRVFVGASAGRQTGRAGFVAGEQVSGEAWPSQVSRRIGRTVEGEVG